MTRPAHTLVTFSGLIGEDGGEVEAWSCGLRVIGSPDGTLGNAEARASYAMGAFTDALIPVIGTNVSLTKVTVAEVGADDRWVKNPDGSFVKAEWEGEIRGTNTSPHYMPAQAALVISLMTARAGASGKGRIFLPIGRTQLDAAGRITAAACAFYADGASQFIADLNAQFGDVAVVSSKGYASKVTGVRVGRVVDTMRSRRRDIPEEYVTAAVPT